MAHGEDGFGGVSAWNESALPFTTLNRPPGAPGTIGVTDKTFNSATVNWVAANDPDGDTITYDVQYRTCGTGSWQLLTATTGLATPLSGLSLHTCYAVRVKARDAFTGESAWTEADPAFTTLNRAPTAPGTPTVASPGYTDATVTWGTSSDADGDAITYDLEYKICSAGNWTAAGSAVSPPLALTSLSPHSCYALRVKARDNYSGDSGWVESNPAFTTQNHTPTVPGSLTANSVAFDTASVSWGALSDIDSDPITY